MWIFKQCFLVLCSILLVMGMFGSCNHQKDEETQEDKPVEQVVNGLSFGVSLANPEKRLVEVTWKNMQETDMIVTLTKRITSAPEVALLWPYFDIRFDQVPKSLTPIAFFSGFVTLDEDTVMLHEVLKMNGVPLDQSELPVERIDWIRLAPGEEVSCLFDLGSLFDGASDKKLDSVKVWFGYECEGRKQGGDDEYWRGSVKSNFLEMKR